MSNHHKNTFFSCQNEKSDAKTIISTKRESYCNGITLKVLQFVYWTIQWR